MRRRRNKLVLHRKKRGAVFRKIKSALGWFLFLFVLVAGVVGVVAYRRADGEISRVVSRALQEQFPDLAVSFDAVRLDSTRGIRLYSVKWKRHESSPDADPLLLADEIYVECPLEIKKIVAGQYDMRRVVISHPVLRVNGGLKQLQSDLLALAPTNRNSANRSLSVEIKDASMILNGASISGLHVRLSPGKTNEEEPHENDSEIDAPTRPQTSDEAWSQPAALSPNPPVASADWNSSTVPASSNVGFVSYQPVFDEPSPEPETSSAPSVTKTSAAAPFYWKLEVDASNPYVENLKAVGRIESVAWDISGKVDNLDLATFFPLLRGIAPRQFAQISGVQGKTSLRFDLLSEDGALSSVKTRVDGQIDGAALSSPLLKYPVSDVAAQYTIVNDLIELRKISAICGQTTVKAAFRQTAPFSDNSSSTLRAQFDNLAVTNGAFVRLVNEAKKANAASHESLDHLLNVLDEYRFSGIGVFDVTMEKSNATAGQWAPRNLTIDGRNVEILCVAFPYRLDGLAGRVTLDSAETLSIALESQAAGDPVRVQGRFTNVMTRPKGQVDFLIPNRALDAQVINAVEEKSRETLQNLHPSGDVSARVRISYDPDRTPLEDKFCVEAALTLHNGSIQYQPFPIPISSISGTIYMRDGAWVFSNMTGKSGGATFAAAGSLVSGAGYAALGRAFASANEENASSATTRENADPALALLSEPSPAPPESFTTVPAVAGAPLADDQWRFLLASNVKNFPLGEELRDALAQHDAREELERLRLEGKANGQIRLGYRTDEKRLALQFDATPIPESTSFQPERFPFALTNVEGQVSWREGVLTISGLRARNGNTTYSANVTDRTIPNVGHVLDVAQLRIDQLQIDRDLQSVTTGEFQDFLNYLQPRGCFNVDGALRVVKGYAPNSRGRISWNLRFTMQQNSARPGIELAGICGRIRTFGVAMENTAPLIFGEFDLDSLFSGDTQFANLIGPFYFNGSDVFWGRRAPAIRRTPIYADPFVRQLIDADPLYQTAARPDARRVIRGQDDNLAGFDDSSAPRGVQNSAEPRSSDSNDSESATKPSSTPFPETNVEGGDRSVQARVFGGQAVCDGVFLNGQSPRYRFTTRLQNAALDEMMRVVSPGSQPLKGVVGFNATLQGEGKNIAALKGEGAATIREAQLYELPQIVRILQVLSVQEPGDNAFSSCDVDFKVLGDHVQLSRVLLEGDALTLFGDGWLTIRQQEKLIDLTLSARLGNSKSQIPIVSDVIGAASDQVAQIRVEGNLSSPVVQQDRLPGLKKAWWSIFPEQEPEPTDKAPVERSRPVRDAWRNLIGVDDKEKE